MLLLSSHKTRLALAAWFLFSYSSCGGSKSEPELVKEKDLSLAENNEQQKLDFTDGPTLIERSPNYLTFNLTTSKNAVVYAFYQKKAEPAPTAKTLHAITTAEIEKEGLLKQGVLKGGTTRLTFYNPPQNEELQFFFFLKEIRGPELGAIAALDVVTNDGLTHSSIVGKFQPALQDLPWAMELSFTNNCHYYHLQDAPHWLQLKGKRAFGIPDAISAAKDTFSFKVVGDKNKGCSGEKEFTIPISGDPLVENSWHLKNIGQDSFSWFKPITGLDLNLHEANRLHLTGRGIHVRIADTGMQINHPDLEANIKKDLNTNIEASNPAGCAVCDPHDTTPFLEESVVGDQGTAVAGIIGAVGWNGIGSRGIAPQVTLSAINILSRRMDPDFVVFSDQLNGEFDILNQSWSRTRLQSDDYETLPPEYEEKMKLLVTNGREKKGSLIVKAAGDEHHLRSDANLDPYNNTPWTIVVGSLNSGGSRSGSSNTGSSLWISAPGGEAGFQSDYRMLQNRDFPRRMFQPAIISTDLHYLKVPCSAGYAKNARYFLEENGEHSPVEHMTGSSSGFNLGWHQKKNPDCSFAAAIHGTVAAAPMVSGAIALLLERNPSLSWRDVKHILALTARKVDVDFTERYTTLGKQRVIETLAWTRNAAGFTFHNWYGFGAIDVSAALKMAHPETYINLPPMVDTGWVPVFGAGGSVPGQKPRGLETRYSSKFNQKIETVSLKLSLSTDRLAKMSFELRSPSGTRSILLRMNNGSFAVNPRDVVLTSNAFYGESSEGQWTLFVLSNTADEESLTSLESWMIRFTGTDLSGGKQ